MEERRKCEIAVELLKHQLRHVLLKEVMVNLSDISDEREIPKRDLMEFLTLLLEEIVEEEA